MAVLKTVAAAIPPARNVLRNGVRAIATILWNRCRTGQGVTVRSPAMSRACGENLAIRLTAPATAALAVVRLQGPAAAPFVAGCFDRPTPVAACVHGRWRDADGHVL